MSAGRIIAFVGAALFIIFGALFILASFSPDAQGGFAGTMCIGLVLVLIGFGLIFAGVKMAPKSSTTENVTLKVDLPANVQMDTLKCQSCGGALTPDNIKMVAGAPVVTCPYCNTTYQLTEEPKW